MQADRASLVELSKDQIVHGRVNANACISHHDFHGAFLWSGMRVHQAAT